MEKPPQSVNAVNGVPLAIFSPHQEEKTIDIAAIREKALAERSTGDGWRKPEFYVR